MGTPKRPGEGHEGEVIPGEVAGEAHPNPDVTALVKTTGEEVQSITSSTEGGLEARNPLADQIEMLRELFKDAKGVQAKVRASIETLAAETTDPKKADLWREACERAQRFDGGMRHSFINMSSDQLSIQILTGERDSGRLSVWNNTANQYLDENVISSTFAPLAEPSRMRSVFADAVEGKEFHDLPELARHMRSLLFEKLFEKVTGEILKERTKRLRAKNSLSETDELYGKHYFDSPYWEHVTLDQIKAYAAGDRSDSIFSIEKPEESLNKPLLANL